jgi:hypothetical protein
MGRVSALIDNQPQLAMSASYRHLGQYSGPAEWIGSLELQFGAQNLNTFRRRCASDPSPAHCFLRELTDANTNGISTDKFVTSLTFKHTEPYHLASVTVDGAAVAGFTPIDLQSMDELDARLQWGQRLPTTIADREPRFDLSVEGLESWRANRRTKNRWVGTATLTIPLGCQTSVPVSLNYANKPEYLGTSTKKLGAHLGLTYRVPGGATDTGAQTCSEKASTKERSAQ